LPLSPLKWTPDMDKEYRFKVGEANEQWERRKRAEIFHTGYCNLTCDKVIKNAVMVADNHTLFLPNRVFHAGFSVSGPPNQNIFGMLDHTSLSFTDFSMAYINGRLKTHVHDGQGNSILVPNDDYEKLVMKFKHVDFAFLKRKKESEGSSEAKHWMIQYS